MTRITKTASPARPKTNPARGLFSRKVFPLAPKVPLGGGTAVEVVSVTVTGLFDPDVEGGGAGVGEGEDTVDILFEP